MLVDFELF